MILGKKFWFPFIILISVQSCLAAEKSVLFFKEHIDFYLDSNFFSINGIYSFYNNTNGIVNKKIIFPFADNVSRIDSIRIIDLNILKKLNYIKMENAIYFEISIMPKDTLDINIYYRQKKSIKNTYVLTTTQTWGKPLEEAIYTLTIPETLIVKSFSYKPDSMKFDEETILYTWKKQDFSPKLDFDIILNE